MTASPFSTDGYIVNQALTGDFKYGRHTSPYNGCGWIAVYNILHYLGSHVPPEEVASKMSGLLHLGGLMGTPMKSMTAALKSYGITAVRHTVSSKRIHRYNYIPWGILRYFEFPYIHFVSFVTSPDGYRFFNCEYGEEHHIMQLDDFLQKYSKWPLADLLCTDIKNYRGKKR